MNILFVIPSLKGGGQEKAGMLLCNYLMQYYSVTVVCFEKPKPGEYSYKCPIIRVPYFGGDNIFGKINAGAKRLQQLKKIKKAHNIDISIAFGNTAIIINALSGIGEKKIASVRQSFIAILKEKSLQMKLHLTLYVWALKKANAIVSVSRAINEELKCSFKIENKIYINNGVDAAEIEKLATEPVSFINESTQWIIHSGRFDNSKGHWHLVKIFAEIKKQLPGTGLILLGSCDTSTANGAAIMQFSKQYFTDNNISWSENESELADVMFLGHQANPFKYIKKSTLFIFPSLWEGFPNALIEAMSCGIPVLAADCKTGPREILQPDDTNIYGLLMPTFTDTFHKDITATSTLEHQWAVQAVELLKSPGKLLFYRQQSLIRSADYSIEKMGNKWLNIIGKLH